MLPNNSLTADTLGTMLKKKKKESVLNLIHCSNYRCFSQWLICWLGRLDRFSELIVIFINEVGINTIWSGFVFFPPFVSTGKMIKCCTMAMGRIDQRSKNKLRLFDPSEVESNFPGGKVPSPERSVLSRLKDYTKDLLSNKRSLPCTLT